MPPAASPVFGRGRAVVKREQKGRTLPFVFHSEGAALPAIHARVLPETTVYADEARCWDALHARFATKRINHSVAFMDEDACTNQAESCFARLRRAEIGTHHHISGAYLNPNANEAAWREDNRRKPNGALYLLATAAALAHPIPRQWAGY